MPKNKHLQDNNSQNFILRGFNSILIGVYIILGAYLLESIIHGFVEDSNPLGMLSVQIIEGLSFGVVFFVFLFSSLALFFSNRRVARKNNLKIWNKASKKQFRRYLLLLLLAFSFLIIINNQGIVRCLTPFFLVYLGTTLALLNKEKKKTHYLLATTIATLAVIVILIPTYWNASLLIAGVSFIVYGITHK